MFENAIILLIVGSNEGEETIRKLLNEICLISQNLPTDICQEEKIIVFDYNKIDPSFPVELLKISQPKLRVKQDKKRKTTFVNKPIKPQKVFFERRKK